MKPNIGVFISDDNFSKYAYKRLKKKFKVYPFSISPVSFTESFLISDLNLNSLINYFREKEINKIFFAGKIRQNIVFDKLHSSVKKILLEIKYWYPEEIMKKICEFFEKNGMEIVPQIEIFKQEIAENKVYTYALDEREKQDVEIGFSILKDILKYRIGQSLTIKNGMVLGIEAIEGTDGLIKRTGNYCRDFVFIKGCGYEKDLRFDIPVIGIETVRNLIKYGGKVIAVQAERTIILDKEKVIEKCEKNGIKFVGIK